MQGFNHSHRGSVDKRNRRIDTSDSEEGGNYEFDPNALRRGIGISDNELGPSENFIQNQNLDNVLGHPDFGSHVSTMTQGIHGKNRMSATLRNPERPSLDSDARHMFRVRNRQSAPTRLQMLNFESSNSSLYHGVVPIGLVLSAVRENDLVSDSEDEDLELENQQLYDSK